MGEHRDHVEARVFAPFLEEPIEVVDALHDLVSEPLPARRNVAGAGLGNRRDQIGPLGEQAAVFEREIEQGGEHERGELDRHGVDPVEGLAFRQRVEHIDRAFANQIFEISEAARSRDAAHGLALIGLVRRVHGDEGIEGNRVVGQGRAGRDRERDALRRGEGLPVALDIADVLPGRDRPVPAGGTHLVEVHGILGPQSSEMLLPAVLAEQVRVERIDLVDRELFGARHVATEASLLEFGTGPRASGEPLLAGELHIGHQALAFCVSAQVFPCCTSGSRGSPNAISATMLRWIAQVPPPSVSAGENRNP